MRRGGGKVAALRATLEREFETVVTALPLGARTLELLHPENADTLISEADYVKDERLPYWADIWPSSRVLGAHLLPMQGTGRRVLELGCGVGLVASAAALAGFSVLATDYYLDALRFTRANVWANAGVEIATRHVDWRDFPTDLGTFDLVVASDVLYERPYAELLANAFERTLSFGGVGIIADPGRVFVGEFLSACDARRLDVRRAGQVPFVEGVIRQTIDLYEVWPAAAAPGV